MAPKKPRLKTPAAIHPVPSTRAEVDTMIGQIGAAQRAIDLIAIAMNEALAACKEAYEAEAEPYRRQLEALQAGVQTWCEAHRDEITQGGKVKTAAFTTGEALWRTRPPSVRITGAEAVLDLLQRLGLSRFVRTKAEINKEAMLNEPEAVSGLPGIAISQGEDFVIVPFAVDLNGEAA